MPIAGAVSFRLLRPASCRFSILTPNGSRSGRMALQFIQNLPEFESEMTRKGKSGGNDLRAKPGIFPALAGASPTRVVEVS